MTSNTILWIYIVLLLVGGVIGFLKAGSKVSLITSSVFAALLVIAMIPSFLKMEARQMVVNVVMAVLLVVFAIRLTKTKKFMPSGLMLILTVVALALWNLFH